MKKIKQFANNAFRPDRTEVLTESLQEAERRIDQIKLTCESLAKKVHDCLQVKGKDAVIEKRIKKVPEFLLGSAMINNGKSLGDGSILGEVLAESGQIEMKLGQEVVKYEVQIEESILRPLQTLMDHDLPSIYKLKRQLAKHTADMDIARAKLSGINRHSSALGGSGSGGTNVGGSGSGSGGNKADSIREEYDEALGRVEQCRDNLAAEMYSLIARESEISKLIVDFLNYQRDYHSSVTIILNELISNVDAVVVASIHKPVYGQGLEHHLRASGRVVAYPLELCVCALLESGLEEEGLFRIAGSTSKVKKLKAAFDATLMDLDVLLTEFCDVHVIANALKCYLRELPEPLLTFQLYNDWMGAIRIPDPSTRSEALWRVLERLPPPQKDNLRYLVKFLKELSSHADVNKMSPANIAIVIAPNLLWSAPPPQTQGGGGSGGDDILMGDNSQMGMNMTMTHLYSSLLEQLVSNCSYFFPEELDFFVTCTKPKPMSSSASSDALDGKSHGHGHGLVNGSSFIEGQSQGHDQGHGLPLQRSVSNSSLDHFDEPEGHSPPPGAGPGGAGSPKPILRKKNKPAPTPPTHQQPLSQGQGQGGQKTNKNPLANSFNNVKPFSGSYPVTPNPANSPVAKGANGGGGGSGLVNKSSSSFLESNKLLSKEKREGVWIPPSPKETKDNRRRLDQGQQSQPPVKPPPPLAYQPLNKGEGGSEVNSSAKQKFLEGGGGGGPPPKPESPLRYKSSFKANSVESNSTTTSGSGNRIGGSSSSSTTDNIITGKGGGGGGAITSFGSQAANFASLPRHFHTENSYKSQQGQGGGQGVKATPPARPPSMFGIPPPAPPTLTGSEAVGVVAPVPEYHPPTSGIGFEGVESSLRKESGTGEEQEVNVNVKVKSGGGGKEGEEGQGQVMGQTPVFTRPIPAPRSSLLSQSHSFKESTSTNSGESGTTPSRPEVRERPSIMAKPRDLSRRNLSNNSNPDETPITSLNPMTPSQNEHQADHSSSGGSGGEDLVDIDDDSGKNNVLDSPTERKGGGGQGQGLYPNLALPNRPPRPQPPAPQPNQASSVLTTSALPPKGKTAQESTDL